jgi:hypothetical protein
VLDAGHRRTQRAGIQDIPRDDLDVRGDTRAQVFRAAGQASDLMALQKEPRKKAPTDVTGGASEEDHA